MTRPGPRPGEFNGLTADAADPEKIQETKTRRRAQSWLGGGGVWNPKTEFERMMYVSFLCVGSIKHGIKHAIRQTKFDGA